MLSKEENDLSGPHGATQHNLGRLSCFKDGENQNIFFVYFQTYTFVFVLCF